MPLDSMLLFPVVGVVVMGIVDAASEVPSPGQFHAVLPDAVIDPAWGEGDDVIMSIKSSVDNLLNLSSSLADDVSHIKTMVKENQKCIPEMKVCVYKILVYTGDVDGAGTDGNVMVQLIGEQGASKEQYPDSVRNDFERGAADPFFLELTPLGTLTEAKVNLTSQKPWFLNKIVVKEANFPETYTFHYNNWVNGMVRILASSE